MSIVKRAPSTNYLKKEAKGIVRFITKKGAPVTFTKDGRPVGVGAGKPDVDRAEKEVYASDRQAFESGKEVKRGSVYAPNNSGVANKPWKGPRSRTK